jgi:hypothetical protein
MARSQYQRQKERQEILRKFKEEHPEEFAEMEKRVRARVESTSRALVDINRSDYVKVTHAHLCKDLQCECRIPEVPALTSSVIKTPSDCLFCKSKYEPVIYAANRLSVPHHFHPEHRCGGIYVTRREEVFNSKSKIPYIGPGSFILAGEIRGGSYFVSGFSESSQVGVESFFVTQVIAGTCSKCDIFTHQGALEAPNTLYCSLCFQERSTSSFVAWEIRGGELFWIKEEEEKRLDEREKPLTAEDLGVEDYLRRLEQMKRRYTNRGFDDV